MKLDTGVKYVSVETPMLFSKVCELFITDFAHRAWIHTIDNGRKTMQVSYIYYLIYIIKKSDIANAIAYTQHFDFLMDIIPESITTRSKLNNKIQYYNINSTYLYYNQLHDNQSNDISAFPVKEDNEELVDIEDNSFN